MDKQASNFESTQTNSSERPSSNLAKEASQLLLSVTKPESASPCVTMEGLLNELSPAEEFKDSVYKGPDRLIRDTKSSSSADIEFSNVYADSAFRSPVTLVLPLSITKHPTLIPERSQAGQGAEIR